MAFNAVQVHDLQGKFVGFSIKKDGVDKLHTENLWKDGEQDALAAQLKLLNDDVDIRNFWPDARDPEVQALLEDPEWEKLELRPAEVVDDENSVYVWIEEPSDENPYGKMDAENSIIVNKTVMAPSPVEVRARVKLAMETVARRRAGA